MNNAPGRDTWRGLPSPRSGNVAAFRAGPATACVVVTS
jgi:hypothetical protein